MAESFLRLSDDDRREALLVAEDRTDRPAHLLEKDVWVVWLLSVLFGSSFGGNLVFKGGTSLSKAFGAIRRFSEDIDLTYDIRALVPDLVDRAEGLIPPTRSQVARWSKAIRAELSERIEREVLPLLLAALVRDGLEATIRREDETVYLDYRPLADVSAYSKPTMMLEFGGRATGEPHVPCQVTCDAATELPTLDFPAADVRVMRVERTIWEKMTAMHVVCLGGRRRERMARHWHDIVRLNAIGHVELAVEDRALAEAVAVHESSYFAEKDAGGAMVDYMAAVTGALRLVPTDEVLDDLRDDYERMVQDGWLDHDAEGFSELMERCEAIETEVNRATALAR